jgi:hypothetical protein
MHVESWRLLDPFGLITELRAGHLLFVNDDG